MGNNIHIHAGSTFFRGSIVREHMLRFDPRVVPVFQDGHFTTRFIMACNNGLIGFCRDAKYYYRKRGDSSSTIDTSHHKVSRFDDVYRYGHIPILEEATKRFGFVPRWLQRTVLYELSWEIRRMVDHAASTAFLAQEQLSTYRGLLATAFGYIDADTIRTFELGPANDFIRAGILRRFKGDTLTPGDLIVKVQQADSKRKTFVLSWFSGTPDAAFSATIDGKAVPVLNRKAVATQLLGAPFAYESRVEIFGTTIGTLVVKVNNHPTLIQCVGRPWPSCDLASAFAKLTSPTILITTTRVSEIRAKSREKEVVDRYSGAWLLMDRDMQADDNAEHLYRHIRRCRPNVKAFFVLRSSSRDWSRLQAEGFELIDFGTEEHTLALLNARFLISSHADHYVTNYLSPSEYGDLLDIKFVFLQHGVTKDDISDWLNKKNIALMCTATDPEHLSIASPVSSYKMFPSEVALTGFARHDALIARSSDVPRRLLIMPTWRNTLVGKPLGKGNDRAFRDEFLRSEYLVSWKSLLGSDRLRQSLERHRFEAVFFPHANVEIYLEHFEVPPYMNSLAHDGSASIQDLFISSALLLTDFSSVAFEMAYLNRPVVYYQFDRDKVFNGGHLTRKGYFDYERDGFGPVCLNEASVLASLDAILANNGKPCDEYTMRSMTTFKWRDGRCCERTLDAIENLSAWSGSSTLPGVGFQADLTGRDDKHWLPADVAILRREREVAANSLAREGGY
jgi:CDP-glycerol glycerophosphotransferase (TagB/SpsB family)